MHAVVLAAGVGNVRSVLRAIGHAAPEATAVTTRDPDAVRRADVLIVPGQGAFGAFADAIAGGLDEALRERIRAGVPFLGICLGLQILFEQSEEAPGARGLGIFEGAVRRLAPGAGNPLPHMGWNRAAPSAASGGALVAADYYYFAHSYAVVPADETIAIARTEYGPSFVSAVAHGNVSGVQFHPEKSQRAGLELLTRFFANARAI